MRSNPCSALLTKFTRLTNEVIILKFRHLLRYHDFNQDAARSGKYVIATEVCERYYDEKLYSVGDYEKF
jgi:hypothetical protein